MKKKEVWEIEERKKNHGVEEDFFSLRNLTKKRKKNQTCENQELKQTESQIEKGSINKPIVIDEEEFQETNKITEQEQFLKIKKEIEIKNQLNFYKFEEKDEKKRKYNIRVYDQLGIEINEEESFLELTSNGEKRMQKIFTEILRGFRKKYQKKKKSKDLIKYHADIAKLVWSEGLEMKPFFKLKTLRIYPDKGFDFRKNPISKMPSTNVKFFLIEKQKNISVDDVCFVKENEETHSFDFHEICSDIFDVNKYFCDDLIDKKSICSDNEINSFLIKVKGKDNKTTDVQVNPKMSIFEVITAYLTKKNIEFDTDFIKKCKIFFDGYSLDHKFLIEETEIELNYELHVMI